MAQSYNMNVVSNARFHHTVSDEMTVKTRLNMTIFRKDNVVENPLLKTKLEILQRFETYRLLLGILGKATNKNIAREIIVRADMNPDLPINKLMNVANKFNFPSEILEYLFECMIGASEELIKGAFQ